MTRFATDNRRTAKYLPPEVKPDEIAIESFRLNVVNETSDIKDTDIIESIVEGDVEQTIDGASTIRVVVRDPESVILNSGVFERTIDATVDRLVFRLAALRKNDDYLEIIFEDRDVARLRKAKKVKSMSRRSMTRAQFCIWLVKQSKYEVPYVVPELNKRQPIKKDRGIEADAEKERVRASGIDRDANLKVGGIKATRAQIALMEEALDAAYAIPGMTDAAALAMIVANIGEAKYKRGALNPGSKAEGLFQIMPQYQGIISPRDIEGGVNIFMKIGFTNLPNQKQDWTKLEKRSSGAIEYIKNFPDHSPGAIVSIMEGSDKGNTSEKVRNPVDSRAPDNYTQRYRVVNKFYDKHIPEAKEILKAYGGQGEEVVERQYRKQFRFSTVNGGKVENYWDTIGRLMEDVGWRRFMANGVLYLISDNDLFKSKSLMTVREADEGVLRVNFDFDTNKKLMECSIRCRAERWIAPPGSCVTIEDIGPASGKWIVSRIKQNLFSRDTDVTLIKPQKELPEPASEIRTKEEEVKSGPRKYGKPVHGDVQQIKGVELDSRYRGTQAIFDQFIHPFMKDFGLDPGSQKRPKKYTASGNISNHWVGDNTSYATDYPTFFGLKAAQALATAVGFKSWVKGTYDSYEFRIDNAYFSIQILWQSDADHLDHIHVGVKRVR